MYHIDRLFCEVAAKARFEVITGGLMVVCLFGFCLVFVSQSYSILCQDG